MAIIDPIVNGLNSGWLHTDASQLQENQHYEVDVVIVGTGAGGGVAAEILTQAGLSVIMIEAGPLKSSSDFNMEERVAYPNLYQQAAAMKTADKAIGIFQGRSVGGSTTINWANSNRTPKEVLAFWAQHKSVAGLDVETLAPWFEQMEKRLNIHDWGDEPNRNNGVLKQGCINLGWDYTVTKRNVAGCLNIGYCGMGCPVNAKQSMLVTTIPAALDKGAQLISRAKVVKIEHENGQVFALKAQALDTNLRPTTVELLFKAKHYILSAGAIHTPTLMMRSDVPDPYNLLGKRTFLHPTVLSGGTFADAINAHSGAPQSIYSDEFVWQNGIDGELGYKLAVQPLYPMFVASKTIGYGAIHAELMSQFNQLQATMASIRDGYHPDSQGGQVHLTSTGFTLDYPLTDVFWRAVRRAYASMAELQFSAGALKVMPLSDGMPYLSSWKEAKESIAQMDLAPLRTVVTADHVMGGCPFGEDEKLSMVNSYGQSHYLENLSVMDGSIFPTSLGANPQLSIYGITARNATALAQKLTDGQERQ